MIYKSKNGRTSFETLIILVLVGIFLSIAINRFMANTLAAKEALLVSELTNIRTSIRLYNILNKKYPNSLAELVKKDYLQAYSDDTIIQGKYLQTNSVNETGSPLDPFGMEYHYDSETGLIKCLTKGYETW